MKVLNFYTELLIPAAQLQAGLRELYRRSFQHVRHAVVFTVGGRQVRGLPQALQAVSEQGLDTLSLVNAWLVSGASKTQQDVDNLQVLVRSLAQEWLEEFKTLSADAGLSSPNRALFFQQRELFTKQTLWRKKQPTNEAMKDRLVRFSKRQAQYVKDIHTALGYSAAARTAWLAANVNTQHPLSAGGAVSKWRTLVKNAGHQELGRMLGAAETTPWSFTSHDSSHVGIERLHKLLALLEQIQVEPSAQVQGDDELLPANYVITRVPSGHVSLTVTLRPHSFEWVSKAAPKDLKAFLSTLSQEEQAWFAQPSSKSFTGSLTAATTLLQRAKSWEQERIQAVNGMSARFIAFNDEQLRSALRKKLATSFTPAEQALLRELLEEQKS